MTFHFWPHVSIFKLWSLTSGFGHATFGPYHLWFMTYGFDVWPLTSNSWHLNFDPYLLSPKLWHPVFNLCSWTSNLWPSIPDMCLLAYVIFNLSPICWWSIIYDLLSLTCFRPLNIKRSMKRKTLDQLLNSVAASQHEKHNKIQKPWSLWIGWYCKRHQLML